ncbi:HEPACAM family member 2-like isoform X1 [Turdus rufiventris]|nr:HEPACAM family member 2-like isoform X1 [Turdus rufiventris]
MGREEEERARTLAPCYLADLRPAAGSLVSAVGCTVLLTAPTLHGSGAVAWEYRQGQEQGVILSYGHQHPPNVSRLYRNRATFNESTLSLRVVLQRGDSRLYRLRGQDEATAWFHLHVLEPLPQPSIVGNSVVKAGSNTKLVCSVLHGEPDAYWWKKNGELLLGSERIRFVENSTLCILLATISDSGYYTCVVSNAVSQNETSFLLQVHHSGNVVLSVVLACVVVGVLAGAGLWHCCCSQQGIPSQEVMLASTDDNDDNDDGDDDDHGGALSSLGWWKPVLPMAGVGTGWALKVSSTQTVLEFSDAAALSPGICVWFQRRKK